MQRLSKNRTLVLFFIVFSIIFLQQHLLTGFAVAAEEQNGKKTDAAPKKSTIQPESSLTPEIEIKKGPDEDKRSWFGRNKWWVALSAILLGGTVAALSSGGDDSGSDGNGGSYRLDW